MKKSILFLTALVLFFACSSPFQFSKPKKPVVLVTVEPYVQMVEQIAGDSVDVISVIPPSADPHTWEPTINQISKLHSALYWFTIGEPMEGPLAGKLKESNPNLIQVPLYAGIQRLPEPSAHCAHCLDTHLWLSPRAAWVQAQIIYAALAQDRPDLEPVYRNNLDALKIKLHELDESCKIALAPFDGKILLTSHGAYTYFCHDYGLKQVVIEPTSGKEPRAKDMTRLMEMIKADKPNIIGVFFQPQHANKAASLIATELKLPTFTVDPLAKDYIQTIETLKETIAHNDA